MNRQGHIGFAIMGTACVLIAIFGFFEGHLASATLFAILAVIAFAPAFIKSP